jgi:glycosyltransferase involved in cell wall biosynthesis
MSIRVAHVNVARTYRGGERQTELLIRELAGHDVEQVLVARRGSALAQRFGDIDLEVREVSGQILSVLAATSGVDLIQVHEGRSIYGAYLRHLLSGTPYIATRRVDNRIKNHWFSHQAYRRAAFVVAVAPQVADVVRDFDPEAHVRVIHSGSSGLSVDPARAAAIRATLPGKFIVGHVGALDNSQKAQEHIIEVARRVSDEQPELHFVLVGGGDDEVMLKQAAAGLSNITFIGFVENVGDYLASFDLFVLPSRREGIGSILLDAMEQGLAVVATRVGGVPAIVRDGENGILIDPERPEQLQAAILRLCSEPELRARMGQLGKETAKRYTAKVMGERYLELYESVLGVSIA